MDYVMVSGFRARAEVSEQAAHPLSVGGREGINQHGELAVVEQAKRPGQLTTDRDRFSFKVREPEA